MAVHSLVVGGTRGLGRVLVETLARRGDRVSVLARAKPDRNAIRNVQYCACDLSEPESACSTAIETTRTHGPINYLIFCQRFRGHGDSWQGEFAISVDATRALIEGTTRSFASEGDRAIAIVSSVYSEFVGDSQPASYHATKAAVNQLARYYAVNLGKSGIRVNSVSPFTFLKDESSAYYTGNRQVHNLYQDIIPLGRMGTAADSANLLVFLCSPLASFITGQNIFVDGGLSAVWPENLARRLMSI